MITAIFFESISNHIINYGKDIFMSPKFSSIACLNSSLAGFIPTGILLNIYLPNRVIKLVSFLHSLSRFKFQYPDLISTVVNHLLPHSWDATSSNAGVTKCGLSTALFMSLGSRYNLPELLALIAHTKKLTQGIGSFTGDMMLFVHLGVQLCFEFFLECFWDSLVWVHNMVVSLGLHEWCIHQANNQLNWIISEWSCPLHADLFSDSILALELVSRYDEFSFFNHHLSVLCVSFCLEWLLFSPKFNVLGPTPVMFGALAILVPQSLQYGILHRQIC